MSDRVPEVYESFRDSYPDLVDAFEALSATAHNAGPLGQRSRRLVKLGISIGAGSQGGVRSQVRKALDEGLTAEDIEHAILLSTTTVGLPQMIAAWTWARSLLANTDQ